VTVTTVARATRDKLTVREILEDLADEDGSPLPRSTWDDWRAKGTGPKCIKLPNGQLRVRRAEYERWLAAREAK
jgi:predicted DNA-binding transcriptional regulator AlpA